MNSDGRTVNLSAAILAAGLLFNPWLLGLVFSPGGKIHSPALLVFIVLLELFLTLVGVVFFVKRRRLTPKSILFATVTAILGITVVEAGLRGIQAAVHPRITQSADSRILSAIYPHQNWAPELIHENRAQELEFEQYVGWKTREFHGKYINVNADGRRETPNPVFPLGEAVDTVFCFGGSSMWGAYSRDSNTIPACLSRCLNGRGIHATVLNYGERGFIFTQDVMRLVMLLREGRRPDYAIFYDGLNDVVVASYYGRAGVIGLDREIRKSLELERQPVIRKLGMLAKNFVETHSMIYKEVDRLIPLVAGTLSRESSTGNDLERLDSLAKSIGGAYGQSYAMLDSLSRAYHFQYRCFLQPVAFTKARLADGEASADEQLKDGNLKELFMKSYAMLQAMHLRNFEDLSNVFGDSEKEVFVDIVHTSEEGNELIAGKIASLLFPSR